MHCRLKSAICAMVIFLGYSLGGFVSSEEAFSEITPSELESPASAEITLPVPTRFAIILHRASGVRTLVQENDVLFHPTTPTKSFTIRHIGPESITLRESRSGQTWTWLAFSPFPGLADQFLVGTVLLNQVRYQYARVEKIVHLDPILVSIEGSIGIVTKETLSVDTSFRQATLPDAVQPPSEVTAILNPTLSTLITVKEVEADSYEWEASAMRPVLENPGQLLSDLKVMISPSLSTQTGVGFNVSSAAGDGLLGHGGFTVSNSKLAQFFGIQTGDTIFQINNQQVTNPFNAWWIYQEFIIRNPGQSEIRVDLRRGESLITKTYRLK